MVASGKRSGGERKRCGPVAQDQSLLGNAIDYQTYRTSRCTVCTHHARHCGGEYHRSVVRRYSAGRRLRKGCCRCGCGCCCRSESNGLVGSIFGIAAEGESIGEARAECCWRKLCTDTATGDRRPRWW